MTAPAEIVEILKTLGDAYPERKLEVGTLRLYVENLADISPHLLRLAVGEHIRSSPWFPKISELRLAAAKIAGTRRFETLAPRPSPDEVAAEVWPLILRMYALEDAYFHAGRFDPGEWQALAAEFDLAGRPHRAAAVRHKLEVLQIAETGARHCGARFIADLEKYGLSPDPDQAGAVEVR